MQILKSRVQEEVAKGGKSKEIAERLGINLKQLQGAAEAFGISLRKKPTALIEFIDDTAEEKGKPEEARYLAAKDPHATEDDIEGTSYVIKKEDKETQEVEDSKEEELETTPVKDGWED